MSLNNEKPSPQAPKIPSDDSPTIDIRLRPEKESLAQSLMTNSSEREKELITYCIIGALLSAALGFYPLAAALTTAAVVMVVTSNATGRPFFETVSPLGIAMTAIGFLTKNPLIALTGFGALLAGEVVPEILLLAVIVFLAIIASKSKSIRVKNKENILRHERKNSRVPRAILRP